MVGLSVWCKAVSVVQGCQCGARPSVWCRAVSVVQGRQCGAGLSVWRRAVCVYTAISHHLAITSQTVSSRYLGHGHGFIVYTTCPYPR